jgi:quinol monooxygenase YgiN
MSDQPVCVFASFTPRSGKGDALLEVLRTMVTNTRREPGNEVYDLYSSDGPPRTFHLFERYRDAAALDAHRAADYYKAYRTQLPDLLETPVGVVVLNAVDAAGG